MASPEPPSPPTGGNEPPGPPSGGDEPPPQRRSRTRRILKWTAISMAAIIVLATGLVVADYYYLNGKITVDPLVFPKDANRPSKAPTALKAENFVLIGSDSRAGASGHDTGGSKIQGARSDTTIIMHISASHPGATLISIPRDSYVQIPSCVVGPNGQTSQPEMNKFNAAFSIGGEYDAKYAPSCTVHTIETLTGIHIDHYAVVDFAGFEHMVDALGGVRMCVAYPLKDPVVDVDGSYHGSNLDLPAGKSVPINGFQALALMRARYALDGGGDLPRIKRQQEFVAAMIHKATSTSLLIDPFKLQHFLSAAASALTTDGFGISTMRKLASALHNVGAGGVRLLTVPNTTSAPGLPYGDVAWDPSESAALWSAIRNDTPIPGVKEKKSSSSPSPTASPTPTPSGPALSVPPSGITINVENGTGQNGLAHKVANALSAQGFSIGTIGDAPSDTYTKSVVEYGSTKVQSSQTVRAAVPGSVRHADPTAGSTITLIVGSNYSSIVPVTIGTPSTSTSPTSTSTPKIPSISAAKPGCLS
jgi:LCP family protein required for cell wall assembly